MAHKDKHKVKIHVGALDQITLDWPAKGGTLLLHIHCIETNTWRGVYIRPRAARKLRDACDRYLEDRAGT